MPDRLIQPVGAQLRVVAHALAAEPVGVAAATAVIGIAARLAFGGTQADGLAIIRVATVLTNGEALQQVALATRLLTSAATVLSQLFTHGLEQRGINQRRNRYADPLLEPDLIHAVSPAGLLARAADWAQAGRQGTGPGLAEGRHAAIGRVAQQAPGGTAVPMCLASAGQTAFLMQPPAHRADAGPILADPAEDPPHDPASSSTIS